jgi:predicted nicotinamide N-methyase
VSEPGAATEIASLEAALRGRFDVAETVVDVGRRAVRLLHPANADDLIDEESFVRDERLPYWADLWPSARVLGQHLLAGAPAAAGRAGKSALELGCGAGLVTTCAILAGHDVTATDYENDALEFTRLNALRNTGRAPRTDCFDWREDPARLGRFDLVLASDILYELDQAESVAAVVDATVAPDGHAIIADPGRVGRERMIAAAAARGLVLLSQEEVPIELDGRAHMVAVLALGRLRDRSVHGG